MTAVSVPPPKLTRDELTDLVQQHQAGVFRYLRFLGATYHEAEDLAQETFMAFAQSHFEHRSGPETFGFLQTIARRKLLMLRRQQSRQISTAELEAADEVWSTVAPKDGLEDYLDQMRRCIAQLQGSSRQVIDLYYKQSATHETAAAELGMSPEGARSFLQRVRTKLRECIQRKLRAPPD